MPESLILQAGLWGWLAASSLLLGAWLGFAVRLADRLVAAVMAFLDGIPESLALGLGLLDDGQPSLVLLVAVLLANLPEGLASAASLRAEGR
ncbi:hypothetical protein GCM10027514_29240 [Azotobacter armeniacus]